MLDPKIFEARPGISAVLLPNSPDFTIIAVSNDFVQTTGIPRSELIGKGFFEKFPESPLDPEFTGEQNIRASLNYVLQHKAPHGLPLQRYDLQNSDGSFTEKYWKPYNVPVLSDAGEPVYLIHTSDDVTDTVKARQTQEAHQELEQAYRKIEESERKYRSLFESIDQGFCLVELIYDANGKPFDHLFLEINPVYELQTGLKNVLGKTARQVSPGIEPRWFELYDEVARSGVPARFYEESKALGRWFDVFVYKIGDADSRKVAVLFADITARKQSEQALQESEERFRLIADTVPLSIWITDASGRVDFLNKHWCDYCGEVNTPDTASDVAMKHVHPDDAPILMRVFEEAMQKGEPFEVEQRNRSKSGEYRWFLNRGTPYRDPVSDKIIKWYGISIDIHDRKLAEEQLRRSEEALEKKVQERTHDLEKANQELRRSNQNLEEFAYAASHDMKEPIRKIHFFADRLKDRLKGKLEGEDQRYFERLEAGTKRMSTLIDDLLVYSHVNRGVSSVETVDLNQMLSFVLDDLELHIEQKGAHIKIGSLPTIQGRPRQLQQLFENLIGNALKYCKEGVPPEVGVTSRTVKGDDAGGVPAAAINTHRMYHLITVQDNGIGFPQEDAERIFHVFTRLHGNTEYRGTGVGLSIAQKVVQNHGGHIWADSIPGAGASFHILLPVA